MLYRKLSEVVDAIEPRIDSNLFDNECLERIKSIAEHFPAKLSNYFVFERYLGAINPGVDFSVGLTEEGTQWLASRQPWKELAVIFERSLDNVENDARIRPWLEFDTSQSIDYEATPSVYVGLNLSVSAPSAALALAATLNRGKTTSFDTIARCVAAIPASVTRLYVGAMRRPGTDGIRLSLANFRYDELGEYLSDIGWPGNIASVMSALSPLESVCKHFGVQIDVTSEIGPQLGVELFSDESAAHEAPFASEVRLLKLLLRERLCSPSEFAALTTWPSHTDCFAPLIDRLIDAVNPERVERLLHGSIITTLQHAKYSFAAGGSMRTKIYFGVFLDFR